MDSKQRAALLAQANRLQATLQVGKGGLSPALLAQVLDDFRTRELVKIKVLLETAPEPPRILAEKIAQGVGAQVVRVVGGSMVLFKENPALHEEAGAKKKASAAKQTRVGIRARREKAARAKKSPQNTPGAKGRMAGKTGRAQGAQTKYYKFDKK